MTDEQRNEAFVAARFELLESVPVPDIWSSVNSTARPLAPTPARSVRRSVVVTSAAATVGLVFALGWLVGRHDVAVAPTTPDPVTNPGTTPAPPPSTIPPDATTTASEQASDSTAAPTSSVDGSSSGSDVNGLGITRPVFEDELCPALSASHAEVVEGITFFALPSNLPIAIQIIAEPATTAAEPFAFVERFAESRLAPRDGELVDINGNQVGIEVYDNGNGQAIWELADGSGGYLRSRGLDRAEIADIIESLIPEPLDAAFPGFRIDFDGERPRFHSLYEQLNTTLAGSAHTSECEIPGNALPYSVTAIEGDPIFEYGVVIDRPAPLEVGFREGSLIVISGPADRAAPRVADATNADVDEWDRLLSQPGPLERAVVDRTELIGGQTEVVINVTNLGDVDMTSGSYRLRLIVKDGVSFLVIDTNDLVLHPDAEFQAVTINGRLKTKTTALVGPTQGVRISDGLVTDAFTVSITITDTTDNPLQITETVRLIPQ